MSKHVSIKKDRANIRTKLKLSVGNHHISIYNIVNIINSILVSFVNLAAELFVDKKTAGWWYHAVWQVIDVHQRPDTVPCGTPYIFCIELLQQGISTLYCYVFESLFSNEFHHLSMVITRGLYMSKALQKKYMIISVCAALLLLFTKSCMVGTN